MSDGTFYWRLDAADYVETYGTALPAAFMSHARANHEDRPLRATAQRVLQRRRHGSNGRWQRVRPLVRQSGPALLRLEPRAPLGIPLNATGLDALLRCHAS
jgi:hypothetical protein